MKTITSLFIAFMLGQALVGMENLTIDPMPTFTSIYQLERLDGNVVDTLVIPAPHETSQAWCVILLKSDRLPSPIGLVQSHEYCGEKIQASYDLLGKTLSFPTNQIIPIKSAAILEELSALDSVPYFWLTMTSDSLLTLNHRVDIQFQPVTAEALEKIKYLWSKIENHSQLYLDFLTNELPRTDIPLMTELRQIIDNPYVHLSSVGSLALADFFFQVAQHAKSVYPEILHQQIKQGDSLDYYYFSGYNSEEDVWYHYLFVQGANQDWWGLSMQQVGI